MEGVKLTVEVAEEMAATAVGTSPLSETGAGGFVYGLIKAASRPLGRLYRAVANTLKAFFFGGDGQDLDDWCAQLIRAGFEPRQGASPAFAACLVLERPSSAGTLTVIAGSLFRAQNGAVFALGEDIEFQAGSTLYPAYGSAQPYGLAVAVLPGTSGNVAAGAIDQVVTATGVSAVRNVFALTNGMTRESDGRLRQRAYDFVAGLSGTQPAALRYLALSEVSDTGVRALFAVVDEPPDRPAFARLVIDDGNGFQGFTRPAQTWSGVVPDNGVTEIPFDWPAATTPRLNINGLPVLSGFTLHEERGKLYPEPGLLSAGDEWDIGGHSVYIDLIAKLQAKIEAAPSVGGPGWRAAGGRVQACPATPQNIAITLLIVSDVGYDLNEVIARAKLAVLAFMRALGPGEPLLIFQLLAALHRVAGVRNARVLTPAGDYYPTTKLVTVTTTDAEVKINV